MIWHGRGRLIHIFGDSYYSKEYFSYTTASSIMVGRNRTAFVKPTTIPITRQYLYIRHFNTNISMYLLPLFCFHGLQCKCLKFYVAILQIPSLCNYMIHVFSNRWPVDIVRYVKTNCHWTFVLGGVNWPRLKQCWNRKAELACLGLCWQILTMADRCGALAMICFR